LPRIHESVQLEKCPFQRFGICIISVIDVRMLLPRIHESVYGIQRTTSSGIRHERRRNVVADS